jgi:hypothetical protein
MQLIDNNTYTSHCHGFATDQSRECGGGARIDACGRLLVVLSSGLLIAGGPTVLDTITQASVASLGILFEICHFGLVAYQMFGR